jgi:hypothetical protein
VNLASGKRLACGLLWQVIEMSPKLQAMRLVPSLLVAVASMGLVACGSMSEYERVEAPIAPLPTPAAPQSAYSDEAPAPAPAAPPASTETFEDTDPSAISDFKPVLDQHGIWVDDPNYGTVWVPAREEVGADFAPYVTSGHWALDAGDNYVWVSDYDDRFGWVVFHYGRWVWVSGNGWVWVPGRRYAPAWVVWRAGDVGYDYVGWAPMPPSFYWRSHHVIWLDVYPPAPYVFVSTTYVFHEHVHSHIVGREQVAGVASHTRPYGTSGGHNDTRHMLATPQRGPSVGSGHIPASVSPGTRYQPHYEQARYGSPRGMNRVPAASDRRIQINRSNPVREPQTPHQGATPHQGSPAQHTTPPVQHTAPPVQHTAPPVQHTAPPVQRSAPPAQHSAPSHSPPPSKPSASPSRGRGRR